MKKDDPSISMRFIARVCLLALIYFGAGKIGLSLAVVHPSITAIWAPSGIAVAAFLLSGSRIWPGVFIGAFLVNSTASGNLLTSLAIATGNTLEGITAAYLIGKYASGKHVFEKSNNIFIFIVLGTMCSPLVSATVGVSTLVLSGYGEWVNFNSMWLTWWLGDCVGELVVTPVIMLWSTYKPEPWKLKRIAEALLTLALLVIIAQIVFGGWFHIGFMRYPVAFLCMPILVWTAFRFNQREMALFNFILSVIAISGTIRGYGPFIRSTEHESILLLQVFLGITTIMCVAVSALVSERRKLIHDLQETLTHVKTLSGLLPICAWCKKVRDDRGYWKEVEAYIHEHADVSISHGICPDCLIKQKTEIFGRRKNIGHGDKQTGPGNKE